MSDLNSLRGPSRPAFNPPPAVPPLAPPPAGELTVVVPPAAPAASPQGGERLADAGGADYGAMPWAETLPPPALALPAANAATSAVERAKAWGQRLIQGL